MTKTEKLNKLQYEVREQWRKYDEALAAGKPYVALVQIDCKLNRLTNEMDTLSREIMYGEKERGKR